MIIQNGMNLATTRVAGTVMYDFGSFTSYGRNFMNNLLRGGLAGAAAYKFGGGLISAILIFVVVFWLLGKC